MYIVSQRWIFVTDIRQWFGNGCGRLKWISQKNCFKYLRKFFTIRKLRFCNGREEDAIYRLMCLVLTFEIWILLLSIHFNHWFENRQKNGEKIAFSSWIFFYNWNMLCLNSRQSSCKLKFGSLYLIEWFLCWLSKIAIVADFARRKKSDRKTITIKRCLRLSQGKQRSSWGRVVKTKISENIERKDENKTRWIMWIFKKNLRTNIVLFFSN